MEGKIPGQAVLGANPSCFSQSNSRPTQARATVPSLHVASDWTRAPSMLGNWATSPAQTYNLRIWFIVNYVYGGVYAHECNCPQRPDEVARSPGTGLAVGTFPTWVLEMERRSSEESILNCWAIFPSPPEICFFNTVFLSYLNLHLKQTVACAV